MHWGFRKLLLNGTRHGILSTTGELLTVPRPLLVRYPGSQSVGHLWATLFRRALHHAAALPAVDAPEPVEVVLLADMPGSDCEALPKQGFRRFALGEAVVRGAEGVGLLEPTEVQRRSVPLVLTGQSAFISAETGTGKTAAYVLPLLELMRRQLARHGANEGGTPGDPRTSAEGSQRPLCLVLTPTAELASQVHSQFVALARALPQIRASLVTGASAAAPASQAAALLERQAEVLVATPGRLLTLLQQASESSPPVGPALSLAGVRHWVVDECDRIARMGLLRDVLALFPFLPRPPKDAHQLPMQVLLVSATVTREAAFLLRRFAPSAATVALNPGLRVAAAVKHVVYSVTSRRKAALLEYLLKRKGSFRTCQVLVFVRTRQRAERLAAVLASRGIAAEAVHSGLTGAQRWRAVEAFKRDELQCLVATDVLGRGIDIPGLPVVVNFDMPLSPEDYVHRVGRTGRAGQPGMAVSLVSADAQEVPIGGPHQRAVLREEELLEKVASLTGQRVERRKVPGPWRDVDRHELDTGKAQDLPKAGGEGRGERLGRGSEGAGPDQRPRAGDRLVPERSAAASASTGGSKLHAEAAGAALKGRALGAAESDPGAERGPERATTVSDVVEGMERGLAKQAGIARLWDVEKARWERSQRVRASRTAMLGKRQRSTKRNLSL